jgi:hypothetical protein
MFNLAAKAKSSEQLNLKKRVQLPSVKENPKFDRGSNSIFCLKED